MLQINCRDVTGHTYAELMALCEQAKPTAAEALTEEQKRASRQLLDACAALIDARVAVPRELRQTVAECMTHTDELA